MSHRRSEPARDNALHLGPEVEQELAALTEIDSRYGRLLTRLVGCPSGTAFQGRRMGQLREAQTSERKPHVLRLATLYQRDILPKLLHRDARSDQERT